jgi:hypothetical protein
MHNHWDRPGWWPGRQSFHWFLTFADVGALHTLVAACQRQLAFPFLDPVPAAGLHLTVCRLGFTDELTPAGLDAALSTAAGRCRTLARFTLRVGPLAGSAGAVRFTVTPWEPLLALRDVATDAAASAGTGNGATADSSAFRPHIGIAYCNSSVPTAAILGRVAALRTLPPVDVHVHALHLVRLRRDTRTYQWDVVAALPLGGSTARHPVTPTVVGLPRASCDGPHS